MKFSIKDFFSKREQIRSFLRIWSHLLKKFLMKNFVFCEVYVCYCVVTMWNLTRTVTLDKDSITPDVGIKNK